MTPTQQLAEELRNHYDYRPSPHVFEQGFQWKVYRWVDVIARNNGNLSDEELRTTRDLVGVVSK